MLIRLALVAAALAGSLPRLALAQLAAPLPVVADPKVETLVAPLSGMPTIQRAGEILVVELAAGAASDLGAIEAALTPSFGQVRPRIALGQPLRVTAGAASRLWPGRSIDRLDYRLPVGLMPDLYDLEVAAAGVGLVSGRSGVDAQRRAVSIVARYPTAPRIVVLSDTHAGDPRAVTDVAEDAANRGEYTEVLEYLQRSVGNPANSERWAAFARAIHEINLVRPDFVLVTGDITSLVHPAALPFEYEDAWRLLDLLEVPAFVSPGNHDLYALDDQASGDTDPVVDGEHLWLNYFGPLYYSVDVGPKLHLASLNTFEWPRLDPFPVEDEFDTRAAGRIAPEQFDWLAADLRAARARMPTGTLVSFAHHDPSWMQRRHAWLGENRLETRDLFAEVGLGVHFSGHTHEDRVARYYRGDVVETNGRPHAGHAVRDLHLLRRDGSLDSGYTQEQLGKILLEPAHGPLFVSTTTISSELNGDIWGLGGYWGWRLARLQSRDGKGGLSPADFGYPATEAFLAGHAERPENWTADHARFGLFSYPSFELDQVAVGVALDGAPSAIATRRITSRLLADLKITPRFAVTAAAGQRLAADGGRLLQVRHGEGTAEALVEAVVPANGQLDVTVRPATALDVDPFAFIDRTDVATGVYVTSETVTLTGFTGSLAVSVDNGGQYRVNGGAFTAAAGSVATGDRLSVRHVSAGSANTETITAVAVGSYRVPFVSVTSHFDRTPDAFTFGSRSGVNPGASVESDPVVPAGFNTAIAIAPGPGIEYSVDGAPFTAGSGTLAPGAALTVRHVSSSTPLGYVKTYLKVGGVIGYFTTRTAG